MDRRRLAEQFRDRLTELIGDAPGAKAAFLRDCRVDRSALAQFLNPGNLRLPRAETLRQIAEARGVSVDWLLGIEAAPAGRQELTTSTAFAEVGGGDALTPLDRWKREVEGRTIRYAPSTIPHFLALPELRRGPHDDAVLEIEDMRDHHLEIAMPIEDALTLASRTGHWRHLDRATAAAQLRYMAERLDRLYPGVRLHLYDGGRAFSPPFTVFGQARAALFLGESYLVVTATDQIEAFTAKFDRMIRLAVVGPDRVHLTLRDMAAEM